MDSHMDKARLALSQADGWANKDNVSRDDRELMVGRYMAVAHVEAILAVAEEVAGVASLMAERT